MKTFQISLVLSVLLSITFSCKKKPTACISESTTSASVGDTIRFSSCSLNTDTYVWKVDGDFLNFFDNPFFGNHYVSAGGGGCEDWIELSFFSAGTYSIDLENPILREGTCGSSYKKWSRSDKTSMSITITP